MIPVKEKYLERFMPKHQYSKLFVILTCPEIFIQIVDIKMYTTVWCNHKLNRKSLLTFQKYKKYLIHLTITKI